MLQILNSLGGCEYNVYNMTTKFCILVLTLQSLEKNSNKDKKNNKPR